MRQCSLLHGASDRDLIMQLNANIHYQLFCGIRIHPLNPLINFKNGIKQRSEC
ncbi:MAG: transposase [Prevotellaceae bacterium]|nr:transposase [Prevotellaceae bacterium]